MESNTEVLVSARFPTKFLSTHQIQYLAGKAEALLRRSYQNRGRKKIRARLRDCMFTIEGCHRSRNLDILYGRKVKYGMLCLDFINVFAGNTIGYQ